jgi:hypothetical protein
MASMKQDEALFSAPWGRHVKATTLWGVALLVTLAALPGLLGAAGVPAIVSSLVPLCILVGGAMSGVRQYDVQPNLIVIRRFGWTTRLSRFGLQRVEVVPGVMQGSIRVFGNGGLFALVGRFRNSRLGAYRALVTDADRTVVLHYTDRRVVVSPDRPAEFAKALGVPLLASAPSIGDDAAVGWGGLRWLFAIPPLVGAGIALAIYLETRPLDVQIDADRLHVDGGFYEVALPLAQIREAELRDSRPSIGKRTNGFAFGSTLRGYFNVEGLGRTRVFVDSAKGPYLLLQTEEGAVILRLHDESRTRRLAESLSKHMQISKAP